MFLKISQLYLKIGNFTTTWAINILNNKFLWLYLVFIFIIFSMFFYNLTKGNRYPIPDSLQNYFFSERLAKDNSFVWKDEINKKYNLPIFGSRKMLIRQDGSAVPTSMPGYILILGLVRKIADNLVYFVNPLFAVLALLYLYKISQLIFPDKRLSFLVIILASISAPFLFVANIPFNNIVACAFFLAGLYHLLKIIYLKISTYYDISFSAIFIFLSVLTRTENFLFFVPLIFTLIYLIKKKNFKFNYQHWLCFFGIIIFLFILYAIFNFKIYGTVLGTLSPKGTLLISREIDQSYYYQYSKLERLVYWIFSIEAFKFLFLNLKNKILPINPFLIILFLISIFFIFKEKHQKPIWLSILAVILFQFWFYLTKEWSQSNLIRSISATVVRYILPSWLLMNLFVVYLLRRIFNKEKLKFFTPVLMTLLFFYLIFNLNKFYYNGGYNYFLRTKTDAEKYRLEIQKNIPEKSIVFTRLADKYIFPDRLTAIYSTLIYDPDKVEKNINVINNLLKDNYQVYFVDEGKYFKKTEGDVFIQEIFKGLKNQGLKTKKIKLETSPYDIYQIYI